jgi:hypothetical protein
LSSQRLSCPSPNLRGSFAVTIALCQELIALMNVIVDTPNSPTGRAFGRRPLNPVYSGSE